MSSSPVSTPVLTPVAMVASSVQSKTTQTPSTPATPSTDRRQVLIDLLRTDEYQALPLEERIQLGKELFYLNLKGRA